MAIYIKGKKPRSLRELLKNFFSCVKNSYVTNTHTYNDEEYQSLQCGSGKFRSFENVLECAQTYFPTTDRKKLLKTLLNLKIVNLSGQKCDLYMMSCSAIKRINMFYAPYTISCNTTKSYSKYDSEFSWKDLLKEIDIKTQKDLNNARYCVRCIKHI